MPRNNQNSFENPSLDKQNFHGDLPIKADSSAYNERFMETAVVNFKIGPSYNRELDPPTTYNDALIWETIQTRPDFDPTLLRNWVTLISERKNISKHNAEQKASIIFNRYKLMQNRNANSCTQSPRVTGPRTRGFRVGGDISQQSEENLHDQTGVEDDASTSESSVSKHPENAPKPITGNYDSMSQQMPSANEKSGLSDNNKKIEKKLSLIERRRKLETDRRMKIIQQIVDGCIPGFNPEKGEHWRQLVRDQYLRLNGRKFDNKVRNLKRTYWKYMSQIPKESTNLDPQEKKSEVDQDEETTEVNQSRDCNCSETIQEERNDSITPIVLSADEKSGLSDNNRNKEKKLSVINKWRKLETDRKMKIIQEIADGCIPGFNPEKGEHWRQLVRDRYLRLNGKKFDNKVRNLKNIYWKYMSRITKESTNLDPQEKKYEVDQDEETSEVNQSRDCNCSEAVDEEVEKILVHIDEGIPGFNPQINEHWTKLVREHYSTSTQKAVRNATRAVKKRYIEKYGSIGCQSNQCSHENGNPQKNILQLHNKRTVEITGNTVTKKNSVKHRYKYTSKSQKKCAESKQAVMLFTTPKQEQILKLALYRMPEFIPVNDTCWYDLTKEVYPMLGNRDIYDIAQRMKVRFFQERFPCNDIGNLSTDNPIPCENENSMNLNMVDTNKRKISNSFHDDTNSPDNKARKNCTTSIQGNCEFEERNHMSSTDSTAYPQDIPQGECSDEIAEGFGTKDNSVQQFSNRHVFIHSKEERILQIAAERQPSFDPQNTSCWQNLMQEIYPFNEENKNQVMALKMQHYYFRHTPQVPFSDQEMFERANEPIPEIEMDNALTKILIETDDLPIALEEEIEGESNMQNGDNCFESECPETEEEYQWSVDLPVHMYSMKNAEDAESITFQFTKNN